MSPEAIKELAAKRKLGELCDVVRRNPDVQDAIEAIRQKETVSFDGVFGSGCALTLSAIAEALHDSSTPAEHPLVVIIGDPEQADPLADDIESFLGQRVERFPADETVTGNSLVIDPTFGERVRILKSLAAGDQPDLLIAPIRGLLQPLFSPQTIRDSTRDLRVGESLDVDDFCRWLTDHRYHATTAVELPGEFSLRGGILDLFAVDWDAPVRIEFFDDEVESIRRFSIQDQRSKEKLDSIHLTVLRSDKHDGQTLASYLSPDSVIVQVEPKQIGEAIQQAQQTAASADELLGGDDVLRELARFGQVTLSRLDVGAVGRECRLSFEPIERFPEDLLELRMQIERLGKDHQIFLACETEGDEQRLREILQSTSVAERGELHFVVGSIHAGFRMPREARVVLGADQILNRHDIRRPSRRRLGKAIDSFLDLREGDLVVHLSHGIGRYRGLTVLDKDGHSEEHLQLEFRGGTKIFVPAAKIDLVQKYIGGARTRPQLARIGGKSWLRQKAAAEAAVVDLAADMLSLQAQRSSRPGIAFSSDTEWQREFENSFPFRETTDQLGALTNIKSDMEIARPMDRLLCGDVGYGKTEVAMRAAFKAVENGYQVGVLVPTTVLAEQHHRTFTERMAGFPFDIAKLSRFATAKEQRETIERLKGGQIDIVIGTHRLASRDVEFFNLGLLIIDEEQRFGVEIKERLKTMRASVDVLTMSATPIPRTLHMSLVGVRDISNLETPPDERLAVETRITRFDDEIIRHATLRELNRGGQVYFIHNRVNDIQQLKQRLEYIVPEARIAVGHGQMAEGELEKVMKEFIDHRCDILLATTIVENGLDIPNANTIFIDEADRYGLSDLHQLRGRVGRYKHRAYAYLLIDPKKHLNPNASKRLRAIEEFSDMGAGFAIAMRDLEIRGAGNLLGTEQSGHIAAIGYELYCQLLENAVRALRKMPPRMTLDVDIDLPVAAYLPDDYVGDKRHKIDFYRRLTRLESFDQIREFENELIDRFGPLPPETVQLLQITELKLLAATWQVVAIYLDGTDMVFKFASPERLQQLGRLSGRKLRVVDHDAGYVRLKPGALTDGHAVPIARSILQSDS